MCVKLSNKTSGKFPVEKSGTNKRHEAHNPKIQANAGYTETLGLYTPLQRTLYRIYFSCSVRECQV